jgi:hypothetical protein
MGFNALPNGLQYLAMNETGNTEEYYSGFFDESLQHTIKAITLPSSNMKQSEMFALRATWQNNKREIFYDKKGILLSQRYYDHQGDYHLRWVWVDENGVASEPVTYDWRENRVAKHQASSRISYCQEQQTIGFAALEYNSRSEMILTVKLLNAEGEVLKNTSIEMLQVRKMTKDSKSEKHVSSLLKAMINSRAHLELYHDNISGGMIITVGSIDSYVKRDLVLQFDEKLNLTKVALGQGFTVEATTLRFSTHDYLEIFKPGQDQETSAFDLALNMLSPKAETVVRIINFDNEQLLFIDSSSHFQVYKLTKK